MELVLVVVKVAEVVLAVVVAGGVGGGGVGGGGGSVCVDRCFAGILCRASFLARPGHSLPPPRPCTLQ